MVKPAHVAWEHLSFDYGAGPVLRDLTLEVPTGQMVALLGPNGSGKSTLLGLLAGAIPIRSGRGRHRSGFSGSMRLNGVDLTAVPARERARRIALVPQTAPIPFAFTVREWVSLGRTPYLSPLGGERDADREAVSTALEQAEVSELADRLVGEVSGGERQRAALAMALAQEPSVLLLDEATAHLDLHHQTTLLELVSRRNREQGLTVIAAMHDPNLAALWFERLVVLADHGIAADGTAEEVLGPELLERVFGSKVTVLRHPTAGVPLVALERPDSQH